MQSRLQVAQRCAPVRALEFEDAARFFASDNQGGNMDELVGKLRAFVTENFLFGRKDENLSSDDSLVEKGVIDSTGVLILVAFLEQNLGVIVQDDEIIPENLDSLNRIAAFAARKLGIDRAQETGIETVLDSQAVAVPALPRS
jgi:acyl carrier protein